MRIDDEERTIRWNFSVDAQSANVVVVVVESPSSSSALFCPGRHR
jgi:hypothetical protein